MPHEYGALIAELRDTLTRRRRAKGFVPCPAYGPYVSNPINLYFERWLTK